MSAPEARLMLKLEQRLHREGWDQPAALYVIVRTEDRMRLIKQPAPLHSDPAARLKYIADVMSEPGNQLGELTAMAMAAFDGFHGLLFSHEAWQTYLSTRERGGRAAADTPGSKELRGVLAITVRAKAYYVSRIRGERPSVEEFDDLGGRVADALVRMLRAVAVHLPDGAVDREALAALKVLNNDEMDARVRAAREKS